MPTDLPLESLDGAPLFEGLSDEARRDALDSAQVRELGPGGRFFEQGEPAEAFHVLLDGRVKVTQITPEGEQVLARYVGVGEMFGCIALFGDSHYPGSAEAVLPSRALTWNGPVTAGLMERHPRIALNAMHTLADRVHELQARYQELATERVERRIAHAVLRLARDAGVQVADGVRVSFPLSRQDLAEMTGTTLFSVSRTLSAWERAGLVDAGRQELVLRDAEGLLAVAEDL